jgi:glycerophosphoryl diester phosphodiesterase
MKKTFIWGHRGSGFRNYNKNDDYIVQNSMKSFQFAIEKGVDGIKTEARLSKDNEVILCSSQKLSVNGVVSPINELKCDLIKSMKLENDEPIPTLRNLFDMFKGLDIKYNFDISGPGVGIEIVKIAKEYCILDKIELAKSSVDPRSLKEIFLEIRNFDKNVLLANSVSLRYNKIGKANLELKSMYDLDVKVINVNYNFANYELFKMVKDMGFKFYLWGLLFKETMKKFLKMNYNGEFIDGMFSNFPFRLMELREEIQA